MAVKTDVDLKNEIGLNAEFEKAIETAEWRLSGAQPKFKYVDGKRTDSQSATEYALMCVDSDNDNLIFKTLTVKSEDIKTRDECDALVQSRPKMTVKVTKVVPWISGSENFQKIEFSIWGDVEPVVEKG